MDYSDEHWEKIRDCVLANATKVKERKIDEAQAAVDAAEAQAIAALQEKDRNKRHRLDAEATRLGSIANQTLNDANAFGSEAGDLFTVLRECVSDGLLEATEDEVDAMIEADEAAGKAKTIAALEEQLAKLKD